MASIGLFNTGALGPEPWPSEVSFVALSQLVSAHTTGLPGQHGSSCLPACMHGLTIHSVGPLRQGPCLLQGGWSCCAAKACSCCSRRLQCHILLCWLVPCRCSWQQTTAALLSLQLGWGLWLFPSSYARLGKHWMPRSCRIGQPQMTAGAAETAAAAAAAAAATPAAAPVGGWRSQLCAQRPCAAQGGASWTLFSNALHTLQVG